ncbi:MAG: ATP-binding protein, partial [Brachymonas sp.]
MTVELVGEALGHSFERGLSQLPSINDAVHIVSEGDLKRIYGSEGADQIAIGTLASSESIAVQISLDTLVTRHSAVLGSTGSGKSTTVASLLRSIVRPNQDGGAPASRILLLDLHGEYPNALRDFSRVYSATPQPGENPLFVPYWALNAKDLLEFVAGSLTENQEVAFSDKIYEMKYSVLRQGVFAGLDPQSLTADSPIPFSLKQCWHDLIDFETRTFQGPQRNEPALVSDGNPEYLEPPKYTPAGLGSAGPFLNTQAKGIRRQLNLMRSRLLDHRFDFILHPGQWEPALNGTVTSDLDKL